MKTSFMLLLLVAALMLLPSCAPSEAVAEVSVTPVSATPVYNQPIEQTPASTPTPTASPAVNDDALDEIKEMLQYEFTGLERSESNPRHGNSPFIFGVPTPYYDEESDTLFYVNYGQYNDGFLYARRGDVSEPFIEMPVRLPNFFNEYIYFMSNDDCGILYGITANPFGKIYRYSTVDESIELVLDEEVRMFSIVGDYLYYRTAYSDGFKMGNEPFRLSLNGGEPEATGDFIPQFYGEYQLRFVTTKIVDYMAIGALELVSENETVRIGSAFTVYPGDEWGWFTIVDDTLWYSPRVDEKYQLISIDLPSGEMTYYQSRGDIREYAVLDGVVYVLPYIPADEKSMRFEKCSVGGGSFTSIGEYRTEDNSKKIYGTLEAIRTDGKYLYVVLRTAKYTLPDGTRPYEPEEVLLMRVVFLQDGGYDLENISKPDLFG